MNMDLPLSSNNPICGFKLFARDGSPLEQPLEWTPCILEITGLDEWDKYELYLQGVNLELSQTRKHGSMGIFVDLPRCGLGKYRLELRRKQKSIHHVIFEVRPLKLTKDSFHQLLDDIQFNLPYGIVFSLQKLGGLVGVQVEPWHESLRERELLLLRRAIYGTAGGKVGLLALLAALAQKPQRWLRDEQPWVKAFAARRPYVGGLVQALNRAGNLENGLPMTLPDRRVNSTVDTYENRIVRFLHYLVKKRLHRLQRAGKPEWQEEISAMSLKLANARRNANFLDHVTALKEPPSHVSMLQLKIPVYRAVLETLLELLRIISVQLDHPSMDHPLEELPTLYQYWGTLQVLQAMLSVGEQRGFVVESQRLLRRDMSGLVFSVFPQGRAALILRHPTTGSRISLYPEQSFGRSSTKGFYSLSYQKRPDICIVCEEVEAPPQLLLFDPKYKLISEEKGTMNDSRPLREDIDKMHTYRDAIRHEEIERPVSFAGIIYPGKTEHFGNGIGAIGCIPGYTGQEDIQEVLERFL